MYKSDLILRGSIIPYFTAFDWWKVRLTMVVISVILSTKLLMVERVVNVFNVTMDVVKFCTHG